MSSTLPKGAWSRGPDPDRSRTHHNDFEPGGKLKNRLSLAGLSLVSAAALMLSAITAASAEGPEPEPAAGQPNHEKQIAETVGPDVTGMSAMSYLPGLSADATEEVQAIADSRGASSVSWDRERRQLTVYTEDKFRQPALSAEVRSVTSFETAEYSRAELEAVVDDLVEEGIPGAEIVWAAPRPDTTGVNLGLREPPKARAALSKHASGIPLFVEDYGEVEPAMSRLATSGTYHLGGARVRGPQSSCTSGFAVQSASGGTGMLFADHCGAGGTVWRKTSTLGTTVGTRGTGGGSDLAIIYSHSTATPLPAAYWGAYDADTAVSILGTLTPIHGANICMSGSYSGTVCNNQIVDVGATVRYGQETGPDLVYTDMTISQQMSETPSAGSGDSGGPAIGIINGSAHAFGIISGIGNGTEHCTGIAGSTDPRGRKCSPLVITGPVANVQISPGGFGWSIATTF